MKSRRAVFALLLTAMSIARATAAQPSAEDLGIIPLPRSIETSDGTFQTPQQWTIFGKAPAELDAAALAETYFRKRGSTVYLVKDPAAALRFTIVRDAALAREGYRLSIDQSGIGISAQSEAGLFYGLQTFEQVAETHGAALPYLEIADTPRFAWRSIALDVTRRALPVPVIEACIDVAAHYKFNVFELRFTAQKKVRAPYTQAQIREISDYARKRSVTVVTQVTGAVHATPRIPSAARLSFDAYQGDPSDEPKAAAGILRLQDVYAFEPGGAAGVQASISTEYAADASRLFYMLLPRALALSEVAWSTLQRRDWISFQQRTGPQYARLQSLGIPFRIPNPTLALAGAGNIEFAAVDASAQSVQMRIQSTSVTVAATSVVPSSEIHCTSDGTAPTAASPAYTSPIRVAVRTGSRASVRCITVLHDGRASSRSELVLER